MSPPASFRTGQAQACRDFCSCTCPVELVPWHAVVGLGESNMLPIFGIVHPFLAASSRRHYEFIFCAFICSVWRNCVIYLFDHFTSRVLFPSAARPTHSLACCASAGPEAGADDGNLSAQNIDEDSDSTTSYSEDSDSGLDSDTEGTSKQGDNRTPLTSRLISQEVLLFCFQQVRHHAPPSFCLYHTSCSQSLVLEMPILSVTGEDISLPSYA